MLRTSNKFYPVLALTAARFERLEALRQARPGHAQLTLGYYGYDEDFALVEEGDAPSAQLLRNVAVMAKRELHGALSGAFLAHRGLEALVLREIDDPNLELPIVLARTPEGRLQMTVPDRSYAKALRDRTFTFDFETDETLNRDLRPTLYDEAFIARVTPALFENTAQIIRAHVPQEDEWPILVSGYGGTELAPGCWLYTGFSMKAVKFLVIDPDRYALAPDRPPSRLNEGPGWQQLELPDALGNVADWRERLERHMEGENALSEALGTLITVRGTEGSFKTKPPRTFLWQRFASHL